MKFRHEEPDIEEEWVEDALSAQGTKWGRTRKMEYGDTKQFQYTPEESKQLTKGIVKKVEHYEDGSKTTVFYYDRDY